MKIRKYKDYDLADFLVDEEFRLWVLNPDENRNIFWDRWLVSHPEKKSVVLKARELIALMKFPVSEVTQDQKNQALDLILQGNPSKRDTLPGRNVIKSEPHYLAWYKMAVAASILVLLSVSFYLFNGEMEREQNPFVDNVHMILKKAPFGRKVTTRLPDGTVVTLNSGSEILFPDQFLGNTRDVSLIGEAFFDVKHNPEKPFNVKMNENQVRVLGTSFNIRSYPEDSIVYVSVATGRVAYSIPSGDEVILMPDQMATHHLSKDTLFTGKVDRLQSFGWKDRIIYFKSATLDNIIIELERWYGVKIEVYGGFKTAGTFTGQFENLSLEEVLIGLSYEFAFNFRIDKNRVILNEITN